MYNIYNIDLYFYYKTDYSVKFITAKCQLGHYY